MILITQLYKSVDIRYNELITALKKNIENNYINQIILLHEEKLDIPHHPKVKEIIVGKRLTYKMAFDWAEEHIPSGEIVMLANSDMWFDDTINKIKSIDFSNTVVALSRYDLNKNNEWVIISETPQYSQDTWIYENPIKLNHDSNLTMGVPGCENKLAWVIRNSKKNDIKYNVINPALTIKSYHEHLSNVRNYVATDLVHPWRYPEPYEYVFVSKLDE